MTVPEFPCGVASGDPGPGAITLWTRVDPGLDNGAGVTVDVEIATTPEFGSSTVTTASVPTDASRDHTVHVDLTGLPVGSVLWFRFTAGSATSPLGRTKTTPAPGDDRPVRLAAFSCQRYTHGYYNVHRHLAGMAADPSTDLDVVVSLGDYVYDTGPADGVEVAGRVDPIPTFRPCTLHSRWLRSSTTTMGCRLPPIRRARVPLERIGSTSRWVRNPAAH